MQPTISIIVPIYNVAEYLPDCLDSVSNQSYRELEIILVDDGSTDGSSDICDRYAEKDVRIKVIHKENAGVAEARNAGLDAMTGEYFCFTDGDDTIAPDYVATMFQLLTENHADIAACMYVFQWNDGHRQRTRNAEYPDDHIFTDSSRDALTKMLKTDIYCPTSNCKLYKNIFRKNRFQNYAIGEDMLFVTTCLLTSEKIVMTNRPLYNYIQHDASVMHSVNPDKVYDVVRSGDAMLSILPADDKNLQKAASYYTIEKNLSALMKLYTLPEQTERIKHIQNNIKEHRKTVLFDTTVEFHIRASCAVSYFGIQILYKMKQYHANRRKTKI